MPHIANPYAEPRSRYNSRDHPIAFHKAETLGKVPKKLASAGPAPDLEEAFDVSMGCDNGWCHYS